MDKDIALKFTDKIAKQRNLFLFISLLSVSSNFLLSARVMTKDERIIMVPGLLQEVWVEGGGVSSSYIAEHSPRYLALLLNLNKNSVEHNKEEIMKYISQSDPIYMQKVREYFVLKQEEYKKFGLTTFFTPRSVFPNSKEMSAIVHGSLTTYFGDESKVVKQTSYKLTYEWVHGQLRLKEFVRIKSDEEQASETKSEEERQREIREEYKPEGGR